MQKVLPCFSLFLLLGAAVAASASPITYTLTAIGTGTVNGIDFTDAAVTIQQITDTTDVVNHIAFYGNDGGSTTVTIAGVGTFTLNSDDGFLSQNDDPAIGDATVGLLDSSNRVFYGLDSASLEGYDLNGDIGPVAGEVSTNGFGRETATTSGELDFTALSDTSFEATPVSATPEPSGLALLATGMLGVAGFARRRWNSVRGM